jgi:hypothetical protein
MGSAIIEGFFGLELAGDGLTLQPRLGLNDGYIRVYQPATDRYAAYTYDWDQNVIELNYGTNAEGAVAVKVLKLKSEHVNQVTVDDSPIEFETETVGNDTYTVFNVPGGQHKIEILKGQPLIQPASVEVSASAGENSLPADPEPATPSIAPNPVTPPELPSTPAESSPETEGVSKGDVLSMASPNADEIDAASEPGAPDSIATRNARQTRSDFFRFAGGSLVILICLELMVILAIRRRAGLG